MSTTKADFSHLSLPLSLSHSSPPLYTHTIALSFSLFLALIASHVRARASRRTALASAALNYLTPLCVRACAIKASLVKNGSRIGCQKPNNFIVIHLIWYSELLTKDDGRCVSSVWVCRTGKHACSWLPTLEMWIVNAINRQMYKRFVAHLGPVIERHTRREERENERARTYVCVWCLCVIKKRLQLAHQFSVCYLTNYGLRVRTPSHQKSRCGREKIVCVLATCARELHCCVCIHKINATRSQCWWQTVTAFDSFFDALTRRGANFDAK